MYPSFLSDRKYLGYKILIDTSCGITPINRFENDVISITPVDDSQIDNSNN